MVSHCKNDLLVVSQLLPLLLPARTHQETLKEFTADTSLSTQCTSGCAENLGGFEKSIFSASHTRCHRAFSVKFSVAHHGLSSCTTSQVSKKREKKHTCCYLPHSYQLAYTSKVQLTLSVIPISNTKYPIPVPYLLTRGQVSFNPLSVSCLCVGHGCPFTTSFPFASHFSCRLLDFPCCSPTALAGVICLPRASPLLLAKKQF